MSIDDNDPSRWPDGVQTWQASDEVLAGYKQAREQLSKFQAPLLISADHPHSRMFVACFDGTGNDMHKDPKHITNIGLFKAKVDSLNHKGVGNISAGYQPGVGTQDNDIVNDIDSALGYSYSPRMEQMYYDFCVQARRWKIEDPKAEISLAASGFSRGAVTAALFTRMVEERGIQDPDGMLIARNAHGDIMGLLPTRPPLVPPGRTPQVVGLFDPVATGTMDLVDVRLPPSVMSGFQITALDERRDEFMSKQIIDPGMSRDGRFLAVRVAGAHCDIGGSYLLDGLSVRNGNMMAAYLNATSDVPFLQERTVPTAPEMNVIHHSEQHRDFYTTEVNDLLGRRHAIERLGAPALTVAGKLYDRAFSDIDDAEPRDEILNRPLRFRHIPVAPEREDPSLPEFFNDRPRPRPRAPVINSWNPLFLNMTGAALDGDAQGILMAGRQFARSDAGQAWLNPGRELDRQAAQETPPNLVAQQQAIDNPVRRSPVLHI